MDVRVLRWLLAYHGPMLETVSPEAVERRYERLHPAELAALVAAAPIAWVPIGTLEHHGPHLPFGVDAFEAHGLLLEAAARAGGVVLPPTYVASGCLEMDFKLSFTRELVEAQVRETVALLARRGLRVVVVLTGHGPLDLVHLLKRVCAEATATQPQLRAYGLCWLELNAAAMTGPEEGEPRVVDHAALVETSWMLALQPDLVRLDRLADDPEAAHAGVYGRNPRFTASREWGRESVDAAAALLEQRVTGLLAGEPLDDLADLRRFVACSWPEPLELSGAEPAGAQTGLGLHNPGRAARYPSALEVEIDGVAVDPAQVVATNSSPGETGEPIAAAQLGNESGFYVRRGQTATLAIPALEAGEHDVRLTVGLAGVDRLVIGRRLAVGSAPVPAHSSANR
jgi:creatinine amidohydrolase